MRHFIIIVCLFILTGCAGRRPLETLSTAVPSVAAPPPPAPSTPVLSTPAPPSSQTTPPPTPAPVIPAPMSPPQTGPLFGPREDRGLIASNRIKEASGLVASRRNPGVLWTHNDSGDGSHLYALDTRGRDLGLYTLAGVRHRDWEDITIGPGPKPGRDYLYVGDIGDNQAQNDLKYIYRVLEPTVDAAQQRVEKSLQGAKRITLRYPQGKVDAETLLSDPLNGDLYVITKRSTTVTVYRAPFPQSTRQVIMLEPVTTLTLDRVPGGGEGGQGAVGGDISPSGLEILVKTYMKVYYWSRASGREPLFAVAPIQVPYLFEPQGEAIAWAGDGNGYFTLSEERQGIPARLYFYPRR